MAKHFIGMAGLHGCLPQTCDVYATAQDAAEALAQSHGRPKSWARYLAREGFAALDLKRDGNEYAEIIACDCNDPAVHSDSLD